MASSKAEMAEMTTCVSPFVVWELSILPQFVRAL